MTNEHNIESQFNACMHKEYCLSLKAGQVRPLDENALSHTINMMPWRTNELGPQLREFAAQLWLQFCSAPAAATAPTCKESLKVAPAPAVLQGWKAVPVEPTPEMKAAGINIEVYSEVSDSIGALTWAEVDAIYRAMLAATPAAPSQEPAINLSCKSTQARLAAQWGYVPAPSQPVTLTDEAVNAAAKVLAERFDYPWEHMPEEGRKNMRVQARAVVIAALREKERERERERV